MTLKLNMYHRVLDLFTTRSNMGKILEHKILWNILNILPKNVQMTLG